MRSRERAPSAWSAKSGLCSFYVRRFAGLRRFDDFHTALGCARNLLASRLKTLVSHGILDRVAYKDDWGRGCHEYRLTDKGRDRSRRGRTDAVG